MTGCETPAPRIAPLPAELTACAEEPEPPALPMRDGASGLQLDLIQQERDRLTFEYIIGLRSAWGDCKAKVNGAAAWNRRVGG